MAVQPDDKPTPVRPESTESPSSPMDTKGLAEAMVDLNIARKSILIYPAHHEQVRTSLRRAHQRLSKVMISAPTLTLGVVKSSLMVGDDFLDPKNPVFRQFADILHQHEIAALTFNHGLSERELHEFLKLITADSQEILDKGGIEKMVAERQVKRIQVQSIDYSKLHLTEETAIRRSAAGKSEDGLVLWQSFVTNLMAGRLDGADDSTAQDLPEELDPALLARYLNEEQLDADAALESYDQIISQHLKKTTADESGKSSTRPALANFNQLVQDLNPDLRRQFLAVTFDRCAGPTSEEATEEMLETMSAGMIVDMLQQANQGGKLISPSLLALINKIAQTQIGGQLADKTGEEKEALSRHKVESLMLREDYEHYVDDEYKALLKELTDGKKRLKQAAKEDAEAKRLVAGINDTNLSIHLGKALIGLMSSGASLADYKEWAGQMGSVADDLIECGAFEILVDILKFAKNEYRQQADDGKRKAAAAMLKALRDPALVARAVDMAEKFAGPEDKAAFVYLAGLGKPAVTAILDILAGHERMDPDSNLIGLLKRLGDPVIEGLMAGLRDPRPAYVRRMIQIMGLVGSADTVSQLRPLLENDNPEIQFEALTALLQVQNPWAVILLREQFSSSRADVVLRATQLAGDYKVAEVVPDLAAKLTKIEFSKSEYAKKEEIVRALSRIGDGRAIPALEKFVRRRLSLFPKMALAVKRALFETLDGYPPGQLGTLLNIGRKTRDEQIRQHAQRVMRDHWEKGRK